MSQGKERVGSGTMLFKGLRPGTHTFEVAKFFWKLTHLPDMTLRWKSPAEVARLLGLNASTVRKICTRLADPQRQPHPLLASRKGLYCWYQLPAWDVIKEVEAFFHPDKEFLVHNLRAEGVIPKLYAIIPRVLNGSWRKLPWSRTTKWVRVYDLPDPPQ
ncbi:MAG: hypothetical protein ACFFBD_27745 [Candidatus Hodarchaeota archaeon]